MKTKWHVLESKQFNDITSIFWSIWNDSFDFPFPRGSQLYLQTSYALLTSIFQTVPLVKSQVKCFPDLMKSILMAQAPKLDHNIPHHRKHIYWVLSELKGKFQKETIPLHSACLVNKPLPGCSFSLFCTCSFKHSTFSLPTSLQRSISSLFQQLRCQSPKVLEILFY